MLTESMSMIASRNQGTIEAAVECLLRVPGGGVRRRIGGPARAGGSGEPNPPGWRAGEGSRGCSGSLNYLSIVQFSNNVIDRLHCVEDGGPLITSLHWNACIPAFRSTNLGYRSYQCSTHVPSALRCLPICWCSAATGGATNSVLPTVAPAE